MTGSCNWFDRLSSEVQGNPQWTKAHQSCQAAVLALNEISDKLVKATDAYREVTSKAAYLYAQVITGFREVPYQNLMTQSRADAIKSRITNRNDSLEVYQAALFAGDTMEQCISFQLFGGDIKSAAYRNVLLVGLLNSLLPYNDEKSARSRFSVIAAIGDSALDEDVAIRLIEEAIKKSSVPLPQVIQGCKTYIEHCATKPASEYVAGVNMADAGYYMTHNCLVVTKQVSLDRLNAAPRSIQ